MAASTSGLDIWAPVADRADVVAAIGRLRKAGVDVIESRPLGPLTTFGIGGPAAGFVLAHDHDTLMQVMRSYRSADDVERVPFMVIGKGSNLLVADAGFPGIVVKLGAGFKYLTRTDDVVEAGAGEAMPALAAWVAQEGLAGLEFAAGIPASVGGSVRMNAGAHGATTATSLIAVDVMLPVTGETATLTPTDLGFGYRHSELPRGSVVTAARWSLAPDDAPTIRTRLDELRAWRRATQPLRERNCGSVFTNPPNDSAGRLIEAAGLKGKRFGGAAVSAKHSNFITVTPAASADDVIALIRFVQTTVSAMGGPRLVPEVRLVGQFVVASA